MLTRRYRVGQVGRDEATTPRGVTADRPTIAAKSSTAGMATVGQVGQVGHSRSYAWKVSVTDRGYRTTTDRPDSPDRPLMRLSARMMVSGGRVTVLGAPSPASTEGWPAPLRSTRMSAPGGGSGGRPPGRLSRSATLVPSSAVRDVGKCRGIYTTLHWQTRPLNTLDPRICSLSHNATTTQSDQLSTSNGQAA